MAADASDRESPYELLQRGTELMRRRHHAQAAVVLERAARLEPGRGSILEALGRAYFNSAQPERARETFEALLEVDPSSHYGHFALGQSLKRLGRPDEARTHLRLAVALEPRSALYRSALGRLPEPAEPESAEAEAAEPAERPEPGGRREPGEPAEPTAREEPDEP
jgi:Flp pilus assembly protein TadD